ncbi:MAG: hypothetical protein VKJ04_05045 [Vampirovibrionales bacterium]|nr:hypothetical protein [Vampirovibrionales bacterium]
MSNKPSPNNTNSTCANNPSVHGSVQGTYEDIAGLFRDAAYFRTLKRDSRRQRWRRRMRKLHCLIERVLKVPQWENAYRAYRQGQLKPPTLSICIITMNSAERIVPLLKYLRPYCDELVVGVDSKTTDNTFEACQGLCDELFVIESTALTCNAGLEPLVGRCHKEWILRLDDDEFPEPEFFRWLPGILNQKNITHYKMPRLHLSNTQPLSWIDDGYLYPDYQMRLFINNPTLLSFPGAVGHTSIMCAGKRGKIHTPNLIHLNMAINPRFKREAKLKTYIERLNGEWVHPVNEHALLFENFDYAIKPYQHTDKAFCQILKDTTEHQCSIYLSHS